VHDAVLHSSACVFTLCVAGSRLGQLLVKQLTLSVLWCRYSVAVCMSSALYTAIPLLVSILTFTSYIALGNTLDVATALTSLALFDLLRFPLFMLPMVRTQHFRRRCGSGVWSMSNHPGSFYRC
jgi:hypothetical protein